MITKNRYYSFNLGELSVGCQYCVKGEKLVLFTTGLCPRRCYFCPVSDAKFNHDVTFANERCIEQQEEVIQEAEAMNAMGAGITGGDPLMKIKRTLSYIYLLKKKYGSSFHIHLYTSLNLVTKENLLKLYRAGLDEIRFHLDLDSKLFWPKLSLAREFSWKVGVELPVLPAKILELREVIDFVNGKVNFIILNELEVADNSQSKLSEMGLRTKNLFSYAVDGSLETGLELIEYIQLKKLDLPVHLCTAKLKDGVQLANRIMREAKIVRKKFDVMTKDGILVRGASYLPELSPGFKYRQKIAEAPKAKLLAELSKMRERIKQELVLSEEEIFLDEQKIRLLLSAKNLKKHHSLFKRYNLVSAVVKEYPTADQLELEVEFI